MTPKSAVAFAVRLAREALGYSQGEFAKVLGVSQAQMSKFESGHAIPDVLQWERIRTAPAAKDRASCCPSCGCQTLAVEPSP